MPKSGRRCLAFALDYRLEHWQRRMLGKGVRIDPPPFVEIGLVG